jgi:hypothetical protein
MSNISMMPITQEWHSLRNSSNRLNFDSVSSFVATGYLPKLSVIPSLTCSILPLAHICITFALISQVLFPRATMHKRNSEAARYLALFHNDFHAVEPASCIPQPHPVRRQSSSDSSSGNSNGSSRASSVYELHGQSEQRSPVSDPAFTTTLATPTTSSLESYRRP